MSMMFEDREAYAIAEALAAGRIADLDPELTASERGVEFDANKGLFRVPLLGTTVEVAFPGGGARRTCGEKLTGALAVVSMHYLYYRGEPVRAQEWLAYRELPGGREFSRAFESMAEARLGRALGARPEDFRRVAELLGGGKAGVSEHSFVVPALPRVPLMVVLWPAGEREEGASRILFKPSAPYYLHTEDLAALGILCAERMIGLAC